LELRGGEKLGWETAKEGNARKRLGK